MNTKTREQFQTADRTLAPLDAEPALAALPGRLLVLVVELSEELGGFLLVPPHQLLQLFKLTSLLLLVNL